LLDLYPLLTMHYARAGGRGKSTLAKVLYNRLAGSFTHSAFVEIQEGDGADRNAHHLAAAVKGLGASGEAADGAAVLSTRLKGFVRDRRVLLVLDNVWTASQLTALLPTAWGEGSTVIVTSRSARFTDSDAWRLVRLLTNCDWKCDRTVTACDHDHACGKYATIQCLCQTCSTVMFSCSLACCANTGCHCDQVVCTCA
jgi:hypothetical protein